MSGNGFDIRLVSTGGIEDHHAHLLRLDYLDRCLFFSVGNDDHALDAHCLELLSSQAILIGAYEDGQMRASVEIVPDRTGRCGRATLIAESDYQSVALADAMLTRAQAEAAKHGLGKLDLIGMTLPPQAIQTQMARFA